MTIMEQLPLMQRTNNFLNRYGMKVKYLADRTKNTPKVLSTFVHGKTVLYAPQLQRLTAFMDEWDRRMVGFATLDN